MTIRKICFLLLFLLIVPILPAAADVSEYRISEFGSVENAVKSIPQNGSGDIVIIIDAEPWDDYYTEISIPTDQEIISLSIIRPEDKTSVTIPSPLRIYANGIPFTLGEGVTLTDTNIYGGSLASEGNTVSIQSSNVTIAGSVDFVFGGGCVYDSGTSIVENTTVQVEETGVVFVELFGGGYAYGAGNTASVIKTNVIVAGEANYVLGGCFAEEGGKTTVEETAVLIKESAKVDIGLFSGSSAAGKESIAQTGTAKARLEGTVEWGFAGDFAHDGGRTELEHYGQLNVSATGSAREIYTGSFATGEGSTAVIDTAEVMNCGMVQTTHARSQSASGGEAKTDHTAVFACRETDSAE